MKCKCKAKHDMTLIKMKLKQDKSALSHYCMDCGRMYLEPAGMRGTWYESKKSMMDMVEKSDIYTILNESLPKDEISMVDRAKKEVIDEVKEKIVNFSVKK